MVKNFGGNKQKRQGRKFLNAPRTGKLRVVQEDGEVYARVSKLLGNGMCHVVCSDKSTRLCIIRNKFRGRSKRDNTIAPGSFVLVGTREWESEKVNGDGKAKISKCDLLEVYSGSESEKLRETVAIDWSVFRGVGVLGTGTETNLKKNESMGDIYMEGEDDEGFEFNNTDMQDTEKELIQEAKAKISENNMKIYDDNDEEIDVDDI